MKPLLSFFLLSFFFLAANGQNLVPNPSFEDTVACPTTGAAIYLCEDWSSYGETVDYFNDCSSNFGFENPIGLQSAYSGNAYAGLVTFSDPPTEYRELLGVELEHPLSIGTTYYVAYHINKAEGNTFNQVMNASNNIGIRLSTVPYDSANRPIPDNWSHINIDTIVQETEDWIFVSGTVMADSAYQHLIVGNFYDDNNTLLIHAPEPIEYRQAYYFIDEVCLSSNPLDCGITSSDNLVEQATVQIYPNPTSGRCKVISKSAIRAIRILTIDGQIVANYRFSGLQFEIALNLAGIEAGSYVVEITSDQYWHTLLIKAKP